MKRMISVLSLAATLFAAACGTPSSISFGGELPAEIAGRVQDDDTESLYDHERVLVVITMSDGETLSLVEFCRADDRIGDSGYERCDLKLVSPIPPEEDEAGSVGLEGIMIAPENRCSEYDSDDYPYSASVEDEIIAAMGGLIYGPYTGTHFASKKETDIEHIVAKSEAHDSGMCSETDREARRDFAEDLDNLTLASPSVNRHQKSGKDLAEWLPDMNRCWYVNRVIEVKRKYGLTMDQAEVDAALEVLAACTSTEMVVKS